MKISVFQSQDGTIATSSHRPSRHKSPTASSNRTTDMDDSLLGSNLDDSGQLEVDQTDQCYISSSFLSNGSSEHVKPDDEVDIIDPKTSAVLEHLSNKIVRVRDLIKTEQKLRDGM